MSIERWTKQAERAGFVDDEVDEYVALRYRGYSDAFAISEVKKYRMNA